MPRQPADHIQLCMRYCTEILHRPFQVHNDGRILKDGSLAMRAAKELGAGVDEVMALATGLDHILAAVGDLHVPILVDGRFMTGQPQCSQEDDEAYELWTREIGVAPGRCVRIGDKPGGQRYRWARRAHAGFFQATSLRR